MRRSFLALVLLAASTVTTPSAALLAVGTPRPPARVADADGRVLDLAAVRGRPTLIVYEDKDSAGLNADLKAELSRLARGDRYRSAITLVPVADVRGYDFWPVRGFVQDAIRGESKKVGATIYCDWDGSFARAMQIRHGTSTVVLIGSSGKVLFAHEGRIPKEETGRVIQLLRSEVTATR